MAYRKILEFYSYKQIYYQEMWEEMATIYVDENFNSHPHGPREYEHLLYHLQVFKQVIQGARFWGYSSCSFSSLGITECTEFQFRKERS